jgi:hypothetical protein
MNHAALVTVLMIGTIGLAQAQTTSPPPNALLAARLQAGATLERYLQNMRQEFLRLDADGNGKLDAADIECTRSLDAQCSAIHLLCKSWSPILTGTVW